LIEQNDLSIDEYYSAFDRLMSPLLSMVPQCTADDCTTYKFIEKFFTYRFVMGLKSDFEAIRTRLLHGSVTLTMTEALSDLLAEETRLHSMQDLMCQLLTVCWLPLTNVGDLEAVPWSLVSIEQEYSSF
jgi:hypothetical protein